MGGEQSNNSPQKFPYPLGRRCSPVGVGGGGGGGTASPETARLDKDGQIYLLHRQLVARRSPSPSVFKFLSLRARHTMSCIESSDSERSVSPTAAATVRERRRMRLLKRRWNHGVNHNSGVVLSFSAFRRARRLRHQKRMTKEEYLRLKNMVPSVAKQPRVSKVKKIPACSIPATL